MSEKWYLGRDMANLSVMEILAYQGARIAQMKPSEKTGRCGETKMGCAHPRFLKPPRRRKRFIKEHHRLISL